MKNLIKLILLIFLLGCSNNFKPDTVVLANVEEKPTVEEHKINIPVEPKIEWKSFKNEESFLASEAKLWELADKEKKVAMLYTYCNNEEIKLPIESCFSNLNIINKINKYFIPINYESLGCNNIIRYGHETITIGRPRNISEEIGRLIEIPRIMESNQPWPLKNEIEAFQKGYTGIPTIEYHVVVVWGSKTNTELYKENILIDERYIMTDIIVEYNYLEREMKYKEIGCDVLDIMLDLGRK